jgi:hypothetical protein
MINYYFIVWICVILFCFIDFSLSKCSLNVCEIVCKMEFIQQNDRLRSSHHCPGCPDRLWFHVVYDLCSTNAFDWRCVHCPCLLRCFIVYDFELVLFNSCGLCGVDNSCIIRVLNAYAYVLSFDIGIDHLFIINNVEITLTVLVVGIFVV